MSVWKNIARWRQRKNKQRTKLRHKTRSMLMESLESRQMLANLLVTSDSDFGAGSLRDAIATANNNKQADTITFEAGVSNITLRAPELHLTETGEANKTIIRGDTKIFGSGSSRLFTVNSGVFVDLDKLLISGGRSADGGAILSSGNLTISSSTIADSASTGSAGAVLVAGGSTTIVNSTISGNRAEGFGGAIDNRAELTVINSTITGNRAAQDGANAFGGGITTEIGRGSTTLFNTIVAGNARGAGDGTPDDLRGENIKAPSSNNLIGNTATAGGLTNGVNGNRVGNNGSGVRDIGTILDTTLRSNSVGTRTHALVANSPAIDAGKNALVATSLIFDQRAKPRISGNGIDIGAFEFESAPSVNNTFESDGVRFVTTGDFKLTNPSATKRVRTTGGLVQIGLVPAAGSSFAPLLVLQSGVTITTDTSTGDTVFSTGGLVSAVSGRALDLFLGIVDGNDAQRLVIPLKKLLSDGFVIDRNQAGTLTLSPDNTFTPTRVKLKVPLELEGDFGFRVLGGAGFRIEGANRFFINPTGTSAQVGSGPLPIVPASYDPSGKPTPITYTLGGLPFQSDRLTAVFDSAQNRIEFKGRASAQFAGGSIDVEFGDSGEPGFILANNQLSIPDGALYQVPALTVGGVSFGDKSKSKSNFVEITQPGDPVIPVFFGTSLGEGPDKAIDNTLSKYFNSQIAGAGVVVTPQSGSSIVTALRFTTANDSPERDPASYKLEGSSNPNGPFTLISEGNLSLPDTRNTLGSAISFSNSVAYTSYRLTFPTVKNPAAANGMQIAEVDFLRLAGLSLALDQANKSATVRGRANGFSSSLDLGPVGFGVDAVEGDSDSRVGSVLVINDGNLRVIHLPLIALKSAPFTFTNRGSVPSGFMTAEFSPATGVFTVTGSSQTLVRDGSVSAISVSTDSTFRADVGLSFLDVFASNLNEYPIQLTQPGDPVVSVGGDSPSGFLEVQLAIDGTLLKYRNLSTAGSGLIVTPRLGPTVCTTLNFRTGDGPEDRDPASYKLEGSDNPNGPFTLISEGTLELPSQRSSEGRNVNFNNTVAYKSYRLTFPRVKNPETATSTEIAEVLLFGRAAIHRGTEKGQGLRIVNGALREFSIPVDSFNLAANNETPDLRPNQLQFKADPLKYSNYPLIAKFSATEQVFSITGYANALLPTGRIGSSANLPIEVAGSQVASTASFGSRGSSGLVLNGKDGTQSQISFLVSDITWAGTKFGSRGLNARYDVAAKEFVYSGNANWYVQNRAYAVVPNNDNAENIKSALGGFLIQGPFQVDGLDIQTNGFALNFTQNGQLEGGIVKNGESAISIEGKSVRAKPESFIFSSGRLDKSSVSPRIETPLPFVVAGIKLEQTAGKVNFPNTAENNSSDFVYTAGGKVRFAVGDVKTQATLKLPLKLQDGSLYIGDKATFAFDAIKIQDIEFSDGELSATYSEADRRYTFAGQGFYNGVIPVTIGGAHSNPQIIEERGAFKLTNFTPPVVDISVAGVIIKTAKLARRREGDRVFLTGTVDVQVGGAKIPVNLGDAPTRGLVLNAGKVEELSATVKGEFTVGGVSFKSSSVLTYLPQQNELRLTGEAEMFFLVSEGPLSMKVNFGDKGTPGLVIKDGQVQSIQASISANFNLFFVEFGIKEAGFSYNRERQEYRFFGSVTISTPPTFDITSPKGFSRVLDEVSVTLGAGPDAPGLIIKNGELEVIDVAINGSINLRGNTATADKLRLVYTRQTNLLSLTGGLTVTLAKKFTATAAFPGKGLIINLRTGQVQLKGLHLEVGDIQLGKVEIKKLAFTYEVDDEKGETTITGEGILGLFKGMVEVGAKVTIKNNRLSGIQFKVSKTPGIQLGGLPVYLESIEGEVENIDDLENFSIKATVTATIGPAVNIFDGPRAFARLEGSIKVEADKIELEGKLQLLEGLFGNGEAKVTIYLKPREVSVPETTIGGKVIPAHTYLNHDILSIVANIKLFPGDIFRGELDFTVDNSFNVTLSANLGVFVPDGIPKIGGKNLGKIKVYMQIRPNEPRQNSYASFKATVEVLVELDVYMKVDFAGRVAGYVDPPVFSKIDFGFNLRGARDFDFLIPLDDDTEEQLLVAEPTIVLGAVTPVAGTPGGQITYTATTQLPDSTTIDLFVDTEAEGYQGQLIASGLAFKDGQQTFDWEDLAVYAAQPYDPNRPVYVYGMVNDGVNLPVFTAYSAAITPPNFAPGILLPNQQDFNSGGTLVLSAAKGNAIRITDPLATPLPDSMVEVNVRVMGGTLKLAQFSDAVTVLGDESSELRLEGKAADINTLLDSLTYTPQENTFFDDTLTVHVGRFPADNLTTIDASVKLKAHPLSIGLDSSFESATAEGASGETALENAVEYIQNSGPANLLDHIVIQNFASGHINSATITIGNFVAGQDLLDLDIMDQMDLGIHASFDAHQGVLKLTGFSSVETYQRALHLVVFESMGNGIKSLTISLGDAANNRAEFTEAIVIKTVNQAPVVQRGNGLVYVRGGGTQSIDPTLTVSDLENGMLTGASVSFGTGNYVPAEDVFRFTDQNGITGQFDAVTGVLSLSGSASVADYTAALRSVRYENLDPAPWHNRARPHDPNVDGVTSSIDAIVVINDLNSGGSRKLEGSPSQFLLDVTGDGFLSPLDALMVINFLNDTSIGSASPALPTPEPGSSASRVEASDVRSLMVTVTDGQAINGVGTESLRMVVLARPTMLSVPVLTVRPDVVQAAEDETPVILAPALTLTGADHVTLLGADVAVTGNFMAGEDVLRAVGLPDGIRASFDEIHGVLHLRGAAPASEYEFALQNVTYANRATARSGDLRTISFSVRDGVTTPLPVTVTVEAPAMPVVETGFGVLLYTQGRTTLEVDPELVVEYFGGPTLTGAQVAFKANYRADEDRMLFADQNGIAGSFDVSTGVLTLTGTSSIANYQQALRSVQYTNTRVNPIPGYRAIAVTVQFGQKFSAEADRLIDVETKLQPPIITLVTAEQTFVENSAPLTIASTITITNQDIELANGQGHRVLEGAVVRIDGYAAGEDVLTFTLQGNIGGEFDAHQGNLFLFGQASLADYQAVLRTVQYQNVSEAPTETPRSIIFTLADGAHDVDAGAIPLVVQSLHNAPTRLSAAPVALTVLENAAAVSLGLSEIDYAPPSDKEPSLMYTVTLVPAATLGEVRLSDGAVAVLNGTYSLEQLRGATFVPGLNGQGTGTFTFTVAGLDPIRNAPDPAALTESLSVTVAGVVTANPGEAFVAQVYRDLLNRNPTAAELAASSNLDGNVARSEFVNARLVSREFQQQQVAELYETLLHRPAESAELDAFFTPSFAAQADFNDAVLPPTLEIAGQGATSLTNGQVELSEQRHFLRTIASEYAAHDFTAEVTVTVVGPEGDPSGSPNTGDRNAFFGLGVGEPDPTFFDEPRTIPFVQIRLAPDDFLLDGVGSADLSDNATTDLQTTTEVGGTGTHRLRLTWDAETQTATFAVHQDYAGGPFVATQTFAPLDGADNGFDITNARVFFGGFGHVSFDDFVITGEPLVVNLEDVRSQIAGSFEYFQSRGAGNFDNFVTALSHDFLDREPTADERKAWVDALGAGDDLVSVAERIASSGAGTLRTASGLYQQLLHRSPNAFEQVDGARLIQTSGELALVASLLASDEYFSRYGDMNSRDLDQLDEEQRNALILKWLTAGATAGNTVLTEGFESVGVVGDTVSGRGGGTLISSRHVLTAAHLVEGRDISSLRFQVGGTTYGVSRVYVHPGYDSATLGQDGADDIAVLELNREVVNVTPSPLFNGTPQVGDELTLVGFGPRAGDPGDGRRLSVKHVGTTPLDGVTDHLLTWNFDNANESTTVDGDSGSGEFFELDGVYYLAAIASGGTLANSDLGDHAYNTRVDAYFAWIDSVVSAGL